ncbi:MAG: hypothetical protein BWY56_01783 [Acidobacteria bacterium ADurb.Bin340]|nr:MAG: hypothetical protein BWY56_01783 [Acidobacteria bacterium ADurb.Bin340]
MKARASEPASAPTLETERAIQEVDPLLKPLLVLGGRPECMADLQALPPAWWEGLEGAPILQALLDAEGDASLLPEPVLAVLRRLQAAWAPKDEAELVPERIFLSLERAYVMRELQTLKRQMDEPVVQSDPALRDSVERRLAGLLERQRMLERRRRGGRIP